MSAFFRGTALVVVPPEGAFSAFIFFMAGRDTSELRRRIASVDIPIRRRRAFRRFSSASTARASNFSTLDIQSSDSTIVLPIWKHKLAILALQNRARLNFISHFATSFVMDSTKLCSMVAKVATSNLGMGDSYLYERALSLAFFIFLVKRLLLHSKMSAKNSFNFKPCSTSNFPPSKASIK